MGPIMLRPKKNASLSFGWGVAKIVTGIPVFLLGFIPMAVGLLNAEAVGFGHVLLGLLLAAVAACGGYLIYSGSTSCILITRYQKIAGFMQYKNRENVKLLAQVTKQDLTNLVRDLRKMADRGFFPSSYLDLNRGEFVLERDNKPAPLLSDGDIILKEKLRRPYGPALLSIPAVWLIYGIARPYTVWYDFVVAAVLSAISFAAVLMNLPKAHVIKEERYKALPPPEPTAINTGNEDLDGLLSTAMGYVNELNGLSLSITTEKMILPIGELLNISRQIFAFVEKHPEKIRQIRGFMNYYLPTTIKLLKGYSDFSQQPMKGDSIKEGMAKIEDSMNGVVEIFRNELDNLYRDKATDIGVDIDLMLNMLRQRGIYDDFAGTDKNS